MTLERDLLNLAATVDAERARQLASERSEGLAGALGVLLGTAFPALTPHAPQQRAALAAIARDGFRARRRSRALLGLLDAALAQDAPPERRHAALRHAVWAEKARIALRELLPIQLGGASIEVSASELSDLASAACDVALRDAEQAARSRFGAPLRADGEPSTIVALGMGKLGGRELNAGSDVDLIFFYDSDDGASQVSLHEHFTYVAQRCSSTIGTPSADGLIWRVDLRLRPEGSQGPLVNSLAAAERYYETWGRLWERAALLRARPIAGDLALGATLEREVIAPFVYRNVVDPGIVAGMSEFVERARLELSPAPARDLKLGPGGIREAEFFVQALQLVWGGREPTLRVRGTLAALSRLRARGLVSDREARDIAASYAFLRRVEHHVQWASGLQTHLVPSPGPELERLARGLGFGGGERLTSELDAAREVVHRTFLGLTGSEPRARARRLPSEVDGDSAELRRAAAEQLGGNEIGEQIAALASRPDGLLGARTRERYPELADQLIDALADCSDPEQAARALRSLFARFLDPSAYVQGLASDPRALRRLITAFGASAFVAEGVVSRPELADVILFGNGAVSDPRAALAAELEIAAQSLAADADLDEREQNFVGALRLARGRVVLELAVADLAETIGTRDATRLLSELAEEQVRRAMAFVLGDGARGLCVLALGALGGKDLGYGSDLDVIFIFDPEAAPRRDEATPYFVRHAQRVMRLISEPHVVGPGYQLDARLRPSGAHGLLVTSLASFARYHGLSVDDAAESSPAVLSSGAAWERQSLLRARPLAGDAELSRRAAEIAERAAYDGGEPPAVELHRLRARMERELGRESDDRFDLKNGRGGLYDIEFAVQWLQMRHGADPRVRTADTGLGLELLHTLGYLDRAAFDAFSEGYEFLRRLKQRLHVRTGTSSTLLLGKSPDLASLARRMGFQARAGSTASEQLLARYKNVSGDVRAHYLRVLGLTE